MVRKVALRAFIKSGGLIGDVADYFDDIAIVKWLNHTFGYHITVPEFLAEDSPWDEWQLNMHLYYADTFNDPKIKEAANKRRIRERLDRFGHFCIDYEIPRRKE